MRTMTFIDHILAVLIMGSMAAALIYFSAPRQIKDPFWSAWDGTPLFNIDEIGAEHEESRKVGRD